MQLGGQAADLVIVAVNDKGFQALLHSKFKIGGDASAAAGPVGRKAHPGPTPSGRMNIPIYRRATNFPSRNS